MISYNLRRRPALLIAVAALIVLRLAWRPPLAVSATMTVAQCWGIAIALVAAISLAAIATRAAWLAAGAARALARLPRAAGPAPLRDSLLRTGIRGVVCLAAGHRTAFCAGLIRPRVYVGTDLATELAPAELDAVLVHEAVHAQRRDPLRRLMLRACADVLFYLPLVNWTADRQKEQAELAADRVAIRRVGAGAVAGALLTMGDAPTPVPASAFDGATHARVAQLLGDDLPRRHVSIHSVALSLTGLVVATSLMMCLGQTAWTAVS
ncbi:M56 family metallopeptidase [Nonomuraea basaltis]|uniref:M56 family metallopeptidase n=1 Tax=Nonomuraea basaltis TaxID=2495887 RepID=UPI00110C40FD|nr:M56 family metallopeptidase [Nonomuraea basaltis]TMR95781.1 M56 family metallopeptidase [Nonomuraea basaltis]